MRRGVLGGVAQSAGVVQRLDQLNIQHPTRLMK